MNNEEKVMILIGLLFLSIGFLFLFIDLSSFVTGFAIQNTYHFIGFVGLFISSLFFISIGKFFITETIKDMRKRRQSS
jgi:hypothetical protein